MNSPILECYDEGLRNLADHGTHPWSLRDHRGGLHDLPLRRWAAEELDGDKAVLARCTGPTLDVGCGPGRIVASLTRRGVPSLGVDIAAEAVRLTQQRGGLALTRNVFDVLPGEGRWRHVLLLDGNIGIGGRPERLLTRCRDLLAPAGRLLVELADPGTPSRSAVLRLERAGRVSRWFAWAHVGTDAIGETAAAADLSVRETFIAAGRWFVECERT